MPRIDPITVSHYAQQAGFRGNDVVIAVAVAGAESGYNTTAHNANPPDDSYGLMQINMLGGLGPARRARYNLRSNSDLYDPATNLRVAYGIWKDAGNSWHPWSTYNSGSYRKFIRPSIGAASSSDPALVGPTPTPLVPGLPNIPSPTDAISAGLTQFADVFRKSAITTISMLLAIVFLILGVVILLRKQVANFIPAGKAGKLLKGAMRS
jgi:Lysozyme like domain